MILNEFWVLVHRFSDPDAWGLHHLLMVESPEKDGYVAEYCKPFGWKAGLGLRGPGAVYRKTTVGLYDAPHMRSVLSGLHEQVPGLANAPVPPELQAFVYAQIAPIEWQYNLNQGVQEVCDRLSILARREHPAPVSRFAGAQGSEPVSEYFVVVERATLEMESIPPYVVGPYDEHQGLLEMESEASIVFALLTIDAKNEGYVAFDCYLTNKPPEGERVTPPVMAEREQ